MTPRRRPRCRTIKRSGRCLGNVALAGLLVALGAGCGGGSSQSDALEAYTDSGDGCAQAVSAITYADSVLKPLGQEQYQEFTDAVRSRLAAVEGTLALEAKDWPNQATRSAANRVAPLARETAALDASGQSRAMSLLAYRSAAAALVLACRQAVPATATSAQALARVPR